MYSSYILSRETEMLYDLNLQLRVVPCGNGLRFPGFKTWELKIKERETKHEEEERDINNGGRK